MRSVPAEGMIKTCGECPVRKRCAYYASLSMPRDDMPLCDGMWQMVRAIKDACSDFRSRELAGE